MKTERVPLAEGTLVRYYKNGWRVAYFERQEPAVRARYAILIPTRLGKKRIKIPIGMVEVVKP